MELTDTMCSWHLILGATQEGFFKGASLFPQGPLISCACIILPDKVIGNNSPFIWSDGPE